MRRVDAAALTCVLAAAAAALQACDRPECREQGWQAQGRQSPPADCRTHGWLGGRWFMGSGGGPGRPGVTRGGFGGTAGRMVGGFFGGFHGIGS